MSGERCHKKDVKRNISGKYVWRNMSGERCQVKGVTRRMSGKGYQVKEGDVTYVGRGCIKEGI